MKKEKPQGTREAFPAVFCRKEEAGGLLSFLQRTQRGEEPREEKE